MFMAASYIESRGEEKFVKWCEFFLELFENGNPELVEGLTDFLGRLGGFLSMWAEEWGEEVMPGRMKEVLADYRAAQKKPSEQ